MKPQAAITVVEIVELVREPIRAAQLVAAVKSPADGAVAVFDGIVRDNSGGRATLYLEYEAYEPMARRTLRDIAGEMRRRFAVGRVAIVHRLGRLEIGETSILVAAAAPHRSAAFDACRFAIESVKHSAPIWKKEYFADGAVWVEGATPGPVSEAGAASPGGQSES